METILEDYNPEGKIFPLVLYPDPILSAKANPVTEFNDELKTLCLDMLNSMYESPGIGLAAPQVGLSKRIFVIDVNYSREEKEEEDDSWLLSDFDPMIFINPKIIKTDGTTTYEEGCLSLPGIFEDIKRFETIEVEYQDTDGNTHTLNADGLLSICIQHENDHLNGKVFIDHLSSLKRTFFRKKLIKQKKLQS